MTFIFVFTLSMNGFYEWLNIGIRFFSGWNAILPTTWQWNVSKTSAKHEQKLWDIIIVRVRMFLFTWMASSCFGFNAIGIHTHTHAQMHSDVCLYRINVICFGNATMTAFVDLNRHIGISRKTTVTLHHGRSADFRKWQLEYLPSAMCLSWCSSTSV